MTRTFKLNHTIAENVNSKPKDVLSAKRYLYDMGFYEPPQWGLTEFPDRALIDAIRDFQRANGLRVDGVMKPGGESEETIQQIHARARQLQGMGRHGDTILAHISPAEARILKAKGGAGTTNPVTGLLEFYDADKKQGSYIWRTVGDGKVRSSHAERDGETFSWGHPPEGGHPGEAYNCRCRAEERSCTTQRLKLDEIVKELTPLDNELRDLKNRRIPNLEIKIEQNEADIDELETAASILAMGRVLDFVPHPLAKAVQIAAQITAVMVAIKLREIRAELKENKARLEKHKEELPVLERKVESLKNRKKITQQAYDECMRK
jgi:hypothetical protein